MEVLFLPILAGIFALLFAAILAYRVSKAKEGTKEMKDIGQAIKNGSMTFLKREYAMLFPMVIGVAIILWLVIDWTQHESVIPKTAIAYLAGALTSALAGFLGMNIAVKANTRTAATAMNSLGDALRIAFASGSVMGLSVVGLGILGVTILYVIYQDVTYVYGFGLGASSIALFARVGGGIYTKAADVGADLVGKIEAGIPEDDPRNPAVIADNVGDNVGDVAGMGADLFESYVSSLIAAMALAVAATAEFGTRAYDDDRALLPLLIATAGIVSSIIGSILVRTGSNPGFSDLLWALRKGIFAAAICVILSSLLIVLSLDVDFNAFWVILVGLLAGVIIGLVTEYYTSYHYSPTKTVASASQTGVATNIISGIATGMHSTVIPVLAIGTAILISFELLGFYGVALSGVGMLSTLGITLATDAYGPVADNAGGIAEQAGLGKETRERTDALDSLGNTTAATGKGFAIGSAALTSLALMAAYAMTAELFVSDGKNELSLNILNHKTLVGLLIGSMLPYLFSSMTMKAVGRAAFSIVTEVRRQFREIPGLLDGNAEPDYIRCIDISTRGALREMILPGIIAVVAPVATGFILGKDALGGLLIGSIGAGFLLAIFMANAGGAWDNAKKYIEMGNFDGKSSDSHKAAVVGDTVGDPFKDTSGPSLNILLKLMAIVALVFAPVFRDLTPLIGG